jgi:hypothetical protein
MHGAYGHACRDSSHVQSLDEEGLTLLLSPGAQDSVAMPISMLSDFGNETQMH